MKKITIKEKIPTDKILIVDYLAQRTELSKVAIKKAMNIGGCWLSGHKKPKGRVRKAKATARINDNLEFYFDPSLINIEAPQAFALMENDRWGLWYKPAGLLSQGTLYGDRASLLFQVSSQNKNAHLIHRLDREASGIVLMAYDKSAAAALSNMWQEHKVEKFYQAIVKGKMKNNDGEINKKLDGKESKTLYKVSSVGEYTTDVTVQIVTGRCHQIRKHFDSIHHPLMGDPRYGRGNKNGDGLKLVACRLKFLDPISKQEIDFELPEELRLF